MPKTSKRAERKRAARIARAHATQIPKIDTKEDSSRKPRPGYKPPARGIARYPWATAIILLLILLGIAVLYVNHIGPFAQAKTAPKKALASPCLEPGILKQITDVSPAPGPVTIKATQHTYQHPPSMTINTKKAYCAGINTNRGLIVLELDPSLAPQTVNNFVFLAQHHFYDGLTFHRVIQSGPGIHIIQTGDPLGNGTGGPGYTIPAEPVQGNYTAGTVAMAKRSDQTDNSGSQFFINVTDNTSLPKQYNLFGHVVKGMDVVKSIQGPGDDPSTKGIKPDIIDHLIVVMAP
jgi:peptidylprolyl isomerase